MIEKMSGLVWGGGLVFLLLFTGTVYTVKLRAVQFRLPGFLISRVKHKSGTAGISQRKTVCMALGAAMGTGNIAGVAAALAAGGPGAVFWMWVSAFLGMSLVYAENALSAVYSGDDVRGPMAYISQGLGSKALAGAFALMCVFAALGMGGMVQVNAVSECVRQTADVPPVLIAVAAFAAMLPVTLGGAQRIGSAAQALLPAAALLYAGVCIAAAAHSADRIPGAFSAIFTSAFGIKQAAGGAAGFGISKAVAVGLRRGIFSNEAGLGSSPLLHSAAVDTSPYEQSMWSMAEVFTDTVLCCTLTAIALLTAAPDLSPATAAATVLGGASVYFTASVMTVFAFCTVIGWYYCGAEAFRYLSGGRYMCLFCVSYSIIASLGAVVSSGTVWAVSDIFNGLMAFPNLLALLLLINKVRRYKP
ncbi:MAG: sodium:alanine symporter family protein [Ruminococcus sp.]|nr:sodium:alanine symporter family protein [Ruminococcus sp.]